MFSTRPDAPPTQNGQKTDLRVRWKMVKNAHLLPFSISDPSGACTMSQLFSTESSYSIGIFWQKIFVDPPSSKKILTSKIFKILGGDQPSDAKKSGLGVLGRPKIFVKDDPSKVV